MKRGTILTLGLVAAALAGCGGGGGGTNNPPPAAYTLIALAPAALAGVSTQANAIDSAGTVQGGESFTNVSDGHARLWRGTSTSIVDLGPGAVRAVGATVQIGLQGVEGLSSERAYLWRGTAASAVSLHPSGFASSHAIGGDDTIQVGRGRLSDGTSHALLWRGTAASVVDLHPAGYSLSRAFGASGDKQVGQGRLASTSEDRALLWQGTAASVVDLGPGLAWAIANDVQVGQGTVAGFAHAYLWRGTAASRVDLHPSGFNDSRAFGAGGSWQVGYGTTTSNATHAIVWQGTAASAVDLHSTVAGYIVDGASPTASVAQAVDANGNIVGYVRSTIGRDYAVLWKRN